MALEPGDLGPDPVAAFERWLAEAKAGAGQRNPEAMTLCTLGEDGWPQGRVLLLKGVDAAGLVFFTNSRSEKGRALAAHPRAEAVFHWDAMGRQVRVRGAVAPLEPGPTRDYFLTRPLGSRLAAWASRQSLPVPGRPAMEARLREVEREFQGREVGPPAHWWGYRLGPRRFEFWQEAGDRFHDRLVYSLGGGIWTLERLWP